MGYFLNETIFETLNKIDLEENLDPSIDGEALLYEDNEFSKTPAEADKYRTSAEEVLGFELNGNQVDYLATNWSEFYHNAHENEDMRDIIIKKLDKDPSTALSDRQREDADMVDSSEQSTSLLDDEDDIDYYEENPDALHPVFNQTSSEEPSMEDTLNSTPSSRFKPLEVQSWDTSNGVSASQSQDALSELSSMANDTVSGDDFDDDIDADAVNKILDNSYK